MKWGTNIKTKHATSAFLGFKKIILQDQSSLPETFCETPTQPNADDVISEDVIPEKWHNSVTSKYRKLFFFFLILRLLST